MTNEEIRGRMERLNDLLGEIHKQVNEIADREAGRAIAGMPTDPLLDEIKGRLIERSSTVIDDLQGLHDELVGRAE